jgi:hypothetical protein
LYSTGSVATLPLVPDDSEPPQDVGVERANLIRLEPS